MVLITSKLSLNCLLASLMTWTFDLTLLLLKFGMMAFSHCESLVNSKKEVTGLLAVCVPKHAPAHADIYTHSLWTCSPCGVASLSSHSSWLLNGAMIPLLCAWHSSRMPSSVLQLRKYKLPTLAELQSQTREGIFNMPFLWLTSRLLPLGPCFAEKSSTGWDYVFVPNAVLLWSTLFGQDPHKPPIDWGRTYEDTLQRAVLHEAESASLHFTSILHAPCAEGRHELCSFYCWKRSSLSCTYPSSLCYICPSPFLLHCKRSLFPTGWTNWKLFLRLRLDFKLSVLEERLPRGSYNPHLGWRGCMRILNGREGRRLWVQVCTAPSDPRSMWSV